MSLTSKLALIAAIGMLFAMFLFVIFGQITVRRLRKKSEIKQLLGMELASGWDIINVAGALSRPKWFSEKLRKTPIYFMAADERPLYEHTNKFERCLARLFFWSWMSSVALILIIIALSEFGIID
ncbi:hypothetical protein [Halopseudomonas salegens]|uniref:Uncharacterized protein n=1 Tax=Halopseudomonas salegens TaxID=1434072 RepID=A0A1H2FG15_9GAMM|nr:hypothetical protein [Halopseudomonas salegens]SDU06337.1 hypothetical protein SAMN05216210_1534 [Halopseudomonas salegens]